MTVGERIWSLDGDYGTVEAVVVVEDANQPMYNLTVDEAHTFFVGDGDWLVHNLDCDFWLSSPESLTISDDSQGLPSQRNVDFGDYTAVATYDTKGLKQIGLYDENGLFWYVIEYDTVKNWHFHEATIRGDVQSAHQGVGEEHAGPIGSSQSLQEFLVNIGFGEVDWGNISFSRNE